MSPARAILPMFVALSVVAIAPAAEASHWRFGHVTWQRTPDPDDDPRTVVVTTIEGYRSAFIDSNTYSYGDGSSYSTDGATVIATGTDLAGESFTILRTRTTHTYASDGPFTISYHGCCRLTSIVNPTSGQRVEAVVDLSGGNQGSPVSSIPVILQFRRNALNSVPLPIIDPDGDPFTCRFATAAESLIGLVAAQIHPLSISSDCVLSWQTDGTAPRQKYAAQVVVEETDGATRVALDFIIEILDFGDPPECTLNDGPTHPTTPGNPLSISVTGTDADGDDLMVSHLGLPTGATLDPPSDTTRAEPFEATFRWTPTSADVGVHVVTIVFTDPLGRQTVPPCSFAVDVRAFCGNGVVEGDEQCDPGIDVAGDCCRADCSLEPAGAVCNAGSGDACDPDEVCSGESAICPDDTLAAAGTLCNPGSGDLCDPAEFCTGVTDAACPVDVVAPDGTVAQTTTCGVGACASEGVIACFAGVLQPDSCVASDPGFEVCDGVDNDCDASTDEGLDQPTVCGIGACAANGVIACAGGVMQPDTCVPGAPGFEVCDGVDNDCDASTDEGLDQPTLCGIGECAAAGVIECVNGRFQEDTCAAGEPTGEICDALDNDCDGTADEGVCVAPECSELIALSKSEFEGLATDSLGVERIEPLPRTNLAVMPHFDPGDTNAPFTLRSNDADLPAGGSVRATDTEGLMCVFPPVDVPVARGGDTTRNWVERVHLVDGQDPALAYVLDENDGLAIYSLTNLAVSGPELVGSVVASGAQCPDGAFYDDLDARGSTVLLAAGQCGLIIVDASDPMTPIVIAVLDTAGVAEDVVFGRNGTRAYVADSVRGLFVIDISMRDAPVEIARVAASDGLLGEPVAVYPGEFGGILYVATNQGLFLVDLVAPGFPVMGWFDTNPDDLSEDDLTRLPQDVVVANGLAYLSVWVDGLMVIDVADPTHPRALSADPIPTNQVFYNMALTKSRLFVAEGQCGVAVFQIVGSELREVLGSPIAIAGTLADCSSPTPDASLAWSIAELKGRVIVGSGFLNPPSGAFEIIDFVESLEPAPEPDGRLMLGVAIACVATLRAWRLRRTRKGIP